MIDMEIDEMRNENNLNEQTQIDEVQASQRVLFALIEQLVASDDWMALRPIIVSLYKQMRSHFALENALMQQVAYPATAAHMAQHQVLLERLDDASMDVGKGHLNKKAVVAVMTDWAEHHVALDDADLMGFLAQTV